MDFNRHYGTVYDMPGIRYQQDGRYFRHTGEPVDLEPTPPERGEDPADQRKYGTMGPDDLRRPENRALKEQLALYNEEWTTRAAALAFLAKGRE
jgi:hypothetical protein